MQSIARDELLLRPTVVLGACEPTPDNLYQGWKAWIVIYRVKLFHVEAVFIFSVIFQACLILSSLDTQVIDRLPQLFRLIRSFLLYLFRLLTS